MGLIQQSQYTFNSLTSDINTMGYRMNQVNAQFQKLFPSSYAGTPSSAFQANRAAWHNEILGASMVAARSQGSLSTLQDNTDQATLILAQSGGSDSIVAQLQAVDQMLGVMVSQNNTIIQSLTTTGRVLADVAAANASEHLLSDERTQRDLDNYTYRGAPVPPVTTLP